MPEEIEEAASRWLAHLDRRETDAADRDAFERWLKADPRHAAAYARMDGVWHRLLRIPALHTELEQGQRDPPAPSYRKRGLRPYAWAASIACVSLIVGWFATLHNDSRGEIHRLSTEVGGYRRAQLIDGSSVQLNTDTDLSLSFTSTNRRVELLRGDATFRVARDAQRPFVVAAGDATVRAIGTEFNVERRGEAVEILMIEGTAAVEPRHDLPQGGAGEETAPVLRAGQAATAERTRVMVRALSSNDMDRELAWQQGMILFSDSRLDDAIEELNRYNRRHLVIDDPNVAKLRIGGYFRASNVEGFVRVIEREFGVRAIYESEAIRLEL